MTQFHWRICLLVFLICCFFIQGILVYSDKSGKRLEAISPEARAGMKIWRRKNCQACHQIYGFGGLLGPDLTNAANRFSVDTLDAILSLGPKSMPSFQLKREEVEGLLAYLKELDKTGVSQPKGGKLDFTKIPWFEYRR